jgi:hypothetical protein
LLRLDSQYSRSDCSLLREEARKSRDYFTPNRLVYCSTVFNVDHDFFLLVSKEDFRFRHWLELNIRLVGEIENELRMVIELFNPERFCARDIKVELGNCGMKRDVSMLVDVPERIQNPKVFSFVGIPALVWLKRPDGDNSLFGNPEGGFGEGNLVVNGVLPDDRKRNSFGGSGGWRESSCGKLPCQVIERRSEAADKISSNQGNANVWFGRTKFHHVFSAFCIVLTGHSLGMRISPEFYRFVQGVEMYLRPIQLMRYRFDR